MRRHLDTFLIITAAAFATGCLQPSRVEPDAGAIDAGADGGAPDAGLCGATPDQKPVCQPYTCYTCEDQKRPGCGYECFSGGCWTCTDGGWNEVSVDCDPFCRQADAGASGVSCAPADATCGSPSPTCTDDHVASVVDGGCWGECVPFDTCDPIPCDGPEDCPSNFAIACTSGHCRPPL